MRIVCINILMVCILIGWAPIPHAKNADTLRYEAVDYKEEPDEPETMNAACVLTLRWNCSGFSIMLTREFTHTKSSCWIVVVSPVWSHTQGALEETHLLLTECWCLTQTIICCLAARNYILSGVWRVFKRKLHPVADRRQWYPSLLLLAEQKILILSGSHSQWHASQFLPRCV